MNNKSKLQENENHNFIYWLAFDFPRVIAWGNNL